MSGIKKQWVIMTSTGGHVGDNKIYEDWSEVCADSRKWATKNPNITYCIMGLEKAVKAKPIEIEETWPDKPTY